MPKSVLLVRRLLIPGLVTTGLLAGFTREILLAYLFGTSHKVEIFRVAFGLPSILSEALAVSFVAILIRLILSGEANKPAQALRQSVWVAAIFAVGVFLVGIFTMPWQAQLLAPGMGRADHAKLIVAGRICWLMFLFVILSLPMRALMSIRGRIWPGASAQLVRSGGFVLVLGALVFAIGWYGPLAPSVAATCGGAMVLGVHWLALGKRDRWRVAMSIGAPPRLPLMFPTLGAVGAVMITQVFLSAGRIMDRAAATEIGEGMLAGLEYSYSLVMALAAVLGTSTNLVLAPRMGRTIRDSGRLARGHWTLILGVTAAAVVIGGGLTVLGGQIVPFVYQYGAFDSEAADLTSGIFRLHALALGPLVLALLLTQVLLLQGCQRAILVAAVAKTVVKAVALWLVFSAGAGINGIAMTLLCTEVAMALFLGGIVLSRHCYVSDE